MNTRMPPQGENYSFRGGNRVFVCPCGLRKRYRIPPIPMPPGPKPPGIVIPGVFPCKFPLVPPNPLATGTPVPFGPVLPLPR